MALAVVVVVVVICWCGSVVTKSVFGRRTFHALCAWSMVDRWPLCGQTVRYG